MVQSIVFATGMLAVAGVTALPLSAASPFDDYDLAMLRRPGFQLTERVTVFPEGLQELWIRALEREDAELRRMVIDTLGTAYRRGMQDVKETQSRLVTLLDEPDQPLDVIRASAATLIALDARQHDARLAELAAQYGLSVAQIVEPALASWKSTEMQEVWLQRISDSSARGTSMLMAIHGLGELRTRSAADALGRMVNDTGQAIGVRIAAANALGKTQSTGLTPMAEQLSDLSSTAGPGSAVLAIELLSHHDEPAAIELLARLAEHPITAVQSRALEQLFEIDTALVDRRAIQWMKSTDVNVRRWSVRAMVAQHDRGRIEPLCRMLNDVNPSLRREVRDALLHLAEDPGLRNDVIAESMRVLRQEQWRGCEQACVVLARLDHEDSGGRMLELLGHERGEVKVAAAWGLTQLRIEQLLPDMLDHAHSVFDGFRAGQLTDSMPGASLHVAHLFIALGDQKYRPAESLMREYLPKDFSLGEESRAAAAWAIGFLHEESPPNDLIEILTDRLGDVSAIDPESDLVRQMCAVSLGRMGAESAIEDLRKFAGSGGGVSGACSWAIERITGEQPPPTEPQVQRIDDWFLAPWSDAQQTVPRS